MSTKVNGQFYNTTDLLDYYTPPAEFAMWGSGTSFFDFNNDGLDDLTFCSTNSGVYTFVNMGDHFEGVYYFSDLTGILMHATWIDIDNDGDNDFFVSRLMQCPILMLNNGNFEFTDISDALGCPYDVPNSTCASWGDYDEDSYPDLYMSNYHHDEGTTSWLFHNNGDGTFDEVASELGVDGGMSQAFQSMWIDYDMDADLDLLVVYDNSDGTKMFENDGNGNFTDIAPVNGFYMESDLMGLSASDFDHDGDFDFFISNALGNIFMKNNHGIFVNQAQPYGMEVFCTSWACPWIDSKNSTWEDLYVVSNAVCNADVNYYYENTGLNSFNQIEALMDSELPAYSAAKGDYDNDGRYDMIVTTGWQVVDMQLWHNEYEGGHYIKLDLDGTVSNIHGIGTIMKCYVNGDTQIKSVSCGDSYLSQDSQYMIFGTGGDVIVDSLIVQWPSGLVDKYSELAVDQLYTLTEGETLLQLQETFSLYLCEGDSLTLTAAEGTNFLWSDGNPDPSIIVSIAGTYTVDITDSEGSVYSQTFIVENAIDPEPGIISEQPQCTGTSNGNIQVDLDPSSYLDFGWNDGAFPLNRDGLTSGDYTLNVTWTSGCTQSYVITITDPEPLIVGYTSAMICFGTTGTAELTIEGGTPPYSTNWYDADPDSLMAGLYPLRVTDDHSCSVDTTIEVSAYAPMTFTYDYNAPCYGDNTTIEYNVQGGSGDYDVEFAPGFPSLPPGIHDGIIMDDAGCELPVSVSIESRLPIAFDYSYSAPCPGEPATLLYNVTGSGENFEVILAGVDISALYAGTYEGIVTDEAGCESGIAVVIESVLPITFDYTYSTPCPGEPTALLYTISGSGENFEVSLTGADIDALYSGTYEGIVTDEAGCESDITVLIESVPPIAFDYTYTTPCFNEPTALSYNVSGSGENFEVSFTGADPDALYAGTYQVIITDDNLCTLTTDIHIEENPAIIIDANVECGIDNCDIVLNVEGGSPPFAYMWNNDTQAPELVACTEGDYGCVVTDSAGCMNDIQVSVVQDGISHAEEVISVYPVPFRDKLFINMPYPQKLRILNAYGQVVLSPPGNAAYHQLDMSSFPAGVYFIEFDHSFFRIMK